MINIKIIFMSRLHYRESVHPSILLSVPSNIYPSTVRFRAQSDFTIQKSPLMRE